MEAGSNLRKIIKFIIFLRRPLELDKISKFIFQIYAIVRDSQKVKNSKMATDWNLRKINNFAIIQRKLLKLCKVNKFILRNCPVLGDNRNFEKFNMATGLRFVYLFFRRIDILFIVVHNRNRFQMFSIRVEFNNEIKNIH